MNHFTKIVATLGPASGDGPCIEKLIRSGVNIVRLNFSHGSHQDHADRLRLIRETARRLDLPICVVQDLQGPKIRTGKLVSDEIELIEGHRFTLTTQDILGNSTIVSVDFPRLTSVVEPGSRILLADGQMELVVEDIGGDHVNTRVVLGGTLTNHKGVNLPGVKLDIPSFTKKDEIDLLFGLKLGVDAIALSFVRTAEDVKKVRKIITRMAPEQKHLPIIAKMERPEALENLDDILEIADGVMVARGDLGVEMSPEAVPIAQKRIIEAANRHNKSVITATQMLESMMENPRPTRAEASDVANAIFDGTDAVMLSGETAVGRYPVKAVQMMDAIICQAEGHLKQWGRWHGPSPVDSHDDSYFVTLAAREMAHDRNVAAIAVFTRSGKTALMMSKTRPEVPILAFTPEDRTYRLMALFWGVIPHLVPQVNTVEAMLASVEEALITETSIQSGQQIVLICGFPVGGMRPPNLALLHTVGDELKV